MVEVLLGLGVNDGLGNNVFVGVFVAVFVGVSEFVDVGVEDAVFVGVIVDVFVGAVVRVDVDDGVNVAVAVNVTGIDVGVFLHLEPPQLDVSFGVNTAHAEIKTITTSKSANTIRFMSNPSAVIALIY